MDVDAFLRFLFPTVNHDDPSEAVVIAGDEKDNTSWEARRWIPGQTTEPPGRLYFGISTVTMARRQRRALNRVALLKRTWVIGLDDIGTKFPEPRLKPTLILETSPGNFQWFYRLSYPADPLRAAALIDGIAAAGMTDPGADRANRYLRVPGSLNVKRAEPFRARVVAFHPERAWTLAELEIALGVRSSEPRASLEVPATLGEGQVDPVHEWLLAHDMVVGDGKRGWVPIVCPWVEEHTPGPDQATGTDYHPGAPGGFKCLHGHCAERTTRDLKAWILEQDPDINLADLDILAGVDVAAIGADVAAALESVRSSSPAGEQRTEPAGAVRFRVPVAELRSRLLGNYVFVESESGYWSIEAQQVIAPAALDHRWTSQMRGAGLLERENPRKGQSPEMSPQMWFKNQSPAQLRRAAAIVHRLGQPLIVDNFLNIAPPLPVRIEAHNEPTRWLELVLFICRGNKHHARLLFDWFALVVTAWDEKPGWHPLLKGPTQGVGKALMLSPILTYLGPRHCYSLKVKDISSDFTLYLARRLITIGELIRNTRGADTPHDIYNTIKDWTARDTDYVMINSKNLHPYEALNLSCWVLMSNAAVPLPLEEGDRRFMVFEMPDQAMPEAWYKAIIKWRDDDEGWKDVVAWLHRRWDAMSEVDREALRGRAPMTDAKRELILNSAEGIEGAVRLAIDGSFGETWHDLVTAHDVLQSLKGSELLSDQAKRALTLSRVSMALKAAGAVHLFKGKPVEDRAIRRTKRLWCLRADMAKSYQKLGQGKALLDAYDEMRKGAAPNMGENVVKLLKQDLGQRRKPSDS